MTMTTAAPTTVPMTDTATETYAQMSPAKRFKKRYFVYGWLAIELLSLPFAFSASAQIMDRVSFSIPQKVASVVIDSVPGKTQLVVSSNAAFTVAAQNAIGEYDVTVRASGNINGTRFGDNAQVPGPMSACAVATTTAPSVIYRATQKTAVKSGDVLSQAVIIEINYDAALSPKFVVKTQENSAALKNANACTAQSS